MEIGNQNLTPTLAYHLVSDYLKNPTVFKGMIDLWPCRSWTIDDWGKRLKNEKIRFRVGENNKNKVDPIWEGDCGYLESTLEDFSNWLQSWPNISSENEFKDLNPKESWSYADYKYMAQLFEHDSDTLESVDWGVFGFSGRNGKESTIWIGSAGAHTPCHYDTYGYNLVAQLHGKKRWILFPPNQSDHLQPTRIPYEESSVFSKVNVGNPQLNEYPDFQDTTPYVICLQPGDVLFVPRHWWHYVESLDTAVSVNTWIEMDEDDDSRLQEAISRLIITSLAPIISGQHDWLNPTEESTSVDENMMFVQMTLRRLRDKQNAQSVDEVKVKQSCLDVVDEPTPKRARIHCDRDTLKKYKNSVIPIEPVQFDDYLKLLNVQSTLVNENPCRSEQETNKSNFSQLFLNCLVNPDVISGVENLLKKSYGIVNDK